MPQRTIRFSETARTQIDQAAEQGGFSSPTAFIRYAVGQQLSARAERGSESGAEDRLAASLEQLRREVVRLGRGQQALFAYLDTLGKTILTCMPEPPADARPQAVARAKERYERMLKSVAKAMAGDAQAAIQDLAAHVE